MTLTYPQLLLQNAEVEELTGFKTPSRQIQWLHAHGWVYETDRKNRPRVSRFYFDTRMSGQISTSKRETPRMGFLFP